MVVENATSLRRGLAILFALGDREASSGKGLGVTALAELVGSDKSQVSRSLKVLADVGVVERDPVTLDYRIGARLLALAAKSSQRRLLNAAVPLLEELVRELGETAHLSVLRGAEVLTVLSESPNRSVRAAGSIGGTAPVYCTSSGRALLLDHGLDELRGLLAEQRFERLGPNAPTSVRALHERIVAARGRGFALVDEEFEVGLVAAGAPVRDLHGRIVAAINVSAPRFRFADRLTAAGEAVLAAADLLSRELGWLPAQEIA